MRALTWQIGVEGLAQTQASVISFDEKTGALIMRMRRGQERRLAASMALISRIAEQPAHFESMRISGTVSHLKKKPEKNK